MVMTPRCAEQENYDGSASPTSLAARAAALSLASPEDKPSEHEYLAPTLASLRAQEAHLATLDLWKANKEDRPTPVDEPDELECPLEVTQPQIIMWESEKVAIQIQQQAEAKKPEREIVTAVDDWFDLGTLFGCFTCRDKN